MSKLLVQSGLMVLEACIILMVILLLWVVAGGASAIELLSCLRLLLTLWVTLVTWFYFGAFKEELTSEKPPIPRFEYVLWWAVLVTVPVWGVGLVFPRTERILKQVLLQRMK